MAKKELLFVLVISFVLVLVGVVMESKAVIIAGVEEDKNNVTKSEAAPFKINKEDMDFTYELARNTKQLSLDAIKKKWLKLQKMQLGRGGGKEGDWNSAMQATADNKVSLRVFVSTSMPLELLKRYAREANYYKATLVINGLPDGSWRKLSDLVYELKQAIGNENGDDDNDEANNIAMQIDNEAFTEYRIVSVPSFILQQEEDVFSNKSMAQVENSSIPVFDKVVGNIGIRRALEHFEAEGELKQLARKLLRKEQR